MYCTLQLGLETFGALRVLLERGSSTERWQRSLQINLRQEFSGRKMADGKYPMKKKEEKEEEEEIKEAVRRVRKMQYLEVKYGRL